MPNLNSYRCYYHPRPDAPAETGVLPHIQLQAANADTAAQLAYVTLAKPIDRVERVDPVWPFAPLEPMQLRERAALQRAMHDDALRGLPSGFGALA